MRCFSPFDIPGADKAVLSPIHASVYTSIRRPVPPMPHSPRSVFIKTEILCVALYGLQLVLKMGFMVGPGFLVGPFFATSPFDIPGADKAVLSPIHASVYTSIRRPVPPT
jgi:hypothetical protein